VVFEKITKTEEVMVFALSDFYVAVTKDLTKGSIVEANPLTSVAELEFYLSHLVHSKRRVPSFKNLN
jgi:hypothetical protein